MSLFEMYTYKYYFLKMSYNFFYLNWFRTVWCMSKEDTLNSITSVLLDCNLKQTAFLDEKVRQSFFSKLSRKSP